MTVLTQEPVLSVPLWDSGEGGGGGRAGRWRGGGRWASGPLPPGTTRTRIPPHTHPAGKFPARAGLPGSLALCQALRRARAAGWGERRRRRGRGRAPWARAGPEAGGLARKVRVPRVCAGWAPGGCPAEAGSEWEEADTKRGSARPHRPPSCSGPAPRGGRACRRPGQAADSEPGLQGGPARRGRGCQGEKHPKACKLLLSAFFFFSPPAWEEKKIVLPLEADAKRMQNFNHLLYQVLSQQGLGPGLARSIRGQVREWPQRQMPLPGRCQKARLPGPPSPELGPPRGCED